MNRTLVAMLIGIGIGVLIAPDKGSATIKKLKNSLDDLTDKAEDQAGELVNKGKRAFNAGKSRVEDAIN